MLTFSDSQGSSIEIVVRYAVGTGARGLVMSMTGTPDGVRPVVGPVVVVIVPW